MMTTRMIIAFLAATVAIVRPCDAQDPDPRTAAESALARFVGTEGFSGPLHYPFIGLDADSDFVALEGPSDSLPSFSPGNSEEGPGKFSVLSAPVVKADQVHFLALLEDGGEPEVNAQTTTAYAVVTRRDGEWAVQLLAVTPESASNTEAIQSAHSVMERFFDAWNTGDNDAIYKWVNFPHAFLIGNGRTAIARNSSDLVTDFDAMRESEGWHHSAYRDFELVHADDHKVIMKLTFTRHHKDGTVYRTVPVVWVVTKQDGHWGIQIRMILPSIEGN